MTRAGPCLQNRLRPSLRLAPFLTRNAPKRNEFKGFFEISMIPSATLAGPAGQPAPDLCFPRRVTKAPPHIWAPRKWGGGYDDSRSLGGV